MTHNIVVLGGGFGGVYTALQLDKQKRSDINVTLISHENFFLFTPMLAEIAASSIDSRHSVNPLRRLFKRVRFMQADVTAIDFEHRLVVLDLPTGEPDRVAYDHLVIALGSVTNYFGLPGVEDNAIAFKSLGDAIVVRNRVIQRLEQADVSPSPDRQALLTFVIGGGGLAGVEVTGDLNDYVRAAARAYPHVRSTDIRVILLEAGPRLMPELSSSLGSFARLKLEERGVVVECNAAIESATDRSVSVKGLGTIATRNLLWTAGIAPTPFVATLGIPLSKGRIETDQCLRAVGLRQVWAVGDVAHIPDGKGGFQPPTAQQATREGPHAARNILAVLDGHPPKPFTYSTMGMLATVGHHSGVAEFFGIRLSGFPAWWMWRSYYIYRLPRMEKRLRVILDWTLDLFFPRDIVQLKMFQRRDLKDM